MKKTMKILLITAFIFILLGGILVGVAVANGASLSSLDNLDWHWRGKHFPSITYEYQSTDEFGNTLNETYTDVSSLDFEFAVADVTIQYGEIFSINGNNLPKRGFQSYVTNGVWYIEDDDQGRSYPSDNRGSTIVITLPSDFVAKDMDIQMGIGDFTAATLNTDHISLEAGVADIAIEYLSTQSADFDCGVGRIGIYGDIQGDIDVDCGAGSVDLDLVGNSNDYAYSGNTGIGNITINNNDMGASTLARKYRLDLDSGVGSITVNFN